MQANNPKNYIGKEIMFSAEYGKRTKSQNEMQQFYSGSLLNTYVTKFECLNGNETKES